MEIIQRHLEAAGFHPQHVETLKHVGDVASGSALVAYWLGLFASMAAPISTIVGCVATIASAVWFVFRAIDMYWTFEDKLAARRVIREAQKAAYIVAVDAKQTAKNVSEEARAAAEVVASNVRSAAATAADDVRVAAASASSDVRDAAKVAASDVTDTAKAAADKKDV